MSIILESKDQYTGQCHYGMSSRQGDKKEDLSKNVPQGSSAYDYTTKKLYEFDGVEWN